MLSSFVFSIHFRVHWIPENMTIIWVHWIEPTNLLISVLNSNKRRCSFLSFHFIYKHTHTHTYTDSLVPFRHLFYLIMIFYCSFNSKSFSPHIRCKVVAKWPHCEKVWKYNFQWRAQKQCCCCCCCCWCWVWSFYIFQSLHYIYYTYLYIASLAFVKLLDSMIWMLLLLLFAAAALNEHQFRVQQNHCIDRIIFLSLFHFTFVPSFQWMNGLFIYDGCSNKVSKAFFFNNTTRLSMVMHISNSILMLNCWKALEIAFYLKLRKYIFISVFAAISNLYFYSCICRPGFYDNRMCENYNRTWEMLCCVFKEIPSLMLRF